MAILFKIRIAMTSVKDDLINELNHRFGDRSFYTIPELVSVGIFGNLNTARKILEDGKLKFIRSSPRRTLITHTSLVQYLLDTAQIKEKKRSRQM